MEASFKRTAIYAEDSKLPSSKTGFVRSSPVEHILLNA